ncbi:MAG TPA: CoA transferase, partial [Alphaproteobacteria bacterium]|nr:CoA transferase [Alphaproteobacteria bacterium]
ITHPKAGVKMRSPRPAARFGGDAWQVEHHAPMLGEHTEEVLREIGKTTSDIASLREKGVIG